MTTSSPPPDASPPDGSPPALPPVKGSWLSRQRSSEFDATWVYLFPLLCFAVDTFVVGFVMNAAPFLIWLAAGLGMLAFAIRNRPMGPIPAAAVTGMLGAAGLFAGLVFAVLLPISIIGLAVFGLGLLGFVPLATAAVLLNETRQRWARGPTAGDDHYMRRVWSAGIGALVFVTPPLAAHLADQAHQQKQLARIGSTKADERLQGLTALARYPLCLNTCMASICMGFPDGRSTIPAEAEQLKRILGATPDATCYSLLD
jgi:hypothetical protein